MNPQQTLIPGTDTASDPKVRPPKWKHRHKWPLAWKAWCAFVDFIYQKWPRNP